MKPVILITLRSCLAFAAAVFPMVTWPMAYTLQQLQDLRAAIAEGVTKVRFSDGRELQYRSLSEMLQVERLMAAELEAGAGRSRRVYLSFRRA